MRRIWALCVGVCLLGGLASDVRAQASCAAIRANDVNNRIPLTVGDTAIVVARANSGRCAIMFKVPTTSLAGVSCLSTPDGTPTPSAGYPLAIGEYLSLERAGQEEWRCVSLEEGTAATLVVVEERS